MISLWPTGVCNKINLRRKLEVIGFEVHIPFQGLQHENPGSSKLEQGRAVKMEANAIDFCFVLTFMLS